jgi:hypothetical protein
MRHTFFVSYEDGNNKWQLGIPQAFRFEVSELYAHLFLEEYQKGNKLEWVRADRCRYLGIVDIYNLQKIMKRDGIVLKDLEAIQNFKQKYNYKVI